MKKPRIQNYFLCFFYCIAGVELATQLVDLPALHYAIKPLIMASLLAYYLVATQKIFWAFVLALVLGCVGDVLLIFQDTQQLFLFGLLVFLIGHIFYIISFRHFQWMVGVDSTVSIFKNYLFPAFLTFVALYFFVAPYVGSFQIAIAIYGSIIVPMSLVAWHRKGHTLYKSFQMVFGGSLLFILSDSLLAINKFIVTFPLSGFLVMLTYIGAQYFIVKGSLCHPLDNSNAT